MRRYKSVLTTILLGLGLLVSPITLGVAGASTAPGSFVAVTPFRAASGNQIPGTAHLIAAVGGHGGVPASGVSAVVLSITSSHSTADGTLTAYADGTTRPAYSNLNFNAGQAVSATAVTPIGATGVLDVYNTSTGATNIAVDVSGYYIAGVASAAGSFTPLTPARILDTRVGTGAPVGAVAGRHSIALTVRGVGGVPRTAGSVLLKVTALQPTALAAITVYTEGTTVPAYPDISAPAGQFASNLVAVPLSAAGKVDLFVGSVGSSQLAAEVVGYYHGLSAVTAGTYLPLGAARFLDTRSHLGIATTTPIAAGSTVRNQVAGFGGVPTTGATAVVLQVTAWSGTGLPTVTGYQDGASIPGTVNLSVNGATTTSTLITTSLSTGGLADLHIGGTGSVHLTAEVVGYYLATNVSWAALATPALLPGATYSTPSGVACVHGTTKCFVVGNSDAGSYVVATNGSTTGAPTALPVPAGNSRTWMYIAAISCTSTSACIAVGSTLDGGGSGLIETYNGTTWTASSLPRFGSTSDGDLRAISCVTATACTAVGFYSITNPPGGQSYFASLVNGVWQETADNYGIAFTGVSCSAAATCVATATNLADYTGVVQRITGTAYTQSALPNPPLGSDDNTNPPPTGHFAEPEGVSCVTATACVSAGGYLGTDNLYHPLITTLVNGVWTVGSISNPLSGDRGDGDGRVACVGTTNCTFVGGPHAAGILVGGVWTMSIIPNASTTQLDGVSCESATSCVVIGTTDVANSNGKTAIFRLG